MRARTTPTDNLADRFEAVAAEHPGREAVVTAGRRLTFRDLDERANRLAHALGVKGIGPGHRVGIQRRQGSEVVEGILACFKIRAVPVVVDLDGTADELRDRCVTAELRGLVLAESLVPRVAEIAGECPQLNFFFVVDEEFTAGIQLPGAAPYELTLDCYPSQGDWGQRSAEDPGWFAPSTAEEKARILSHHEVLALLRGPDPAGDLPLLALRRLLAGDPVVLPLDR